MIYSAGTGLKLILLFRTILDLFSGVMTAVRRSLFERISIRTHDLVLCL